MAEPSPAEPATRSQQQAGGITVPESVQERVRVTLSLKSRSAAA